MSPCLLSAEASRVIEALEFLGRADFDFTRSAWIKTDMKEGVVYLPEHHDIARSLSSVKLSHRTASLLLLLLLGVSRMCQIDV